MLDRKLSLWRVAERKTKEWYVVFAYSRDEAVKLVADLHYDGISVKEYRSEYTVRTKRLQDDEKLLVTSDDDGTQMRSVREWLEGQSPGPFISSTYEA
jgi:hypothetical protein